MLRADVVLARNIGYVCARLGRKVGKASFLTVPAMT
jgi:hypothetical protein